MTGDPVQGVRLRFGGREAETGSDGTFRLELGPGGESLVADWLVFKQGYCFTYLQRVSIDSSRDQQLAIALRGTEAEAYPVLCSLQGDLCCADGSPVPDATALALDVYGCEGTHSHYECESSGSRYCIGLQADSADCLVVLQVQLAAGHDFVAMARGVDLSAPSPVELDFRAPAEGCTAVQATASQGGNQAYCFFSTPYGPVPGWFQCPGAEPRMRQYWEFLSSSPEEVPVYNPFAWRAYWVQREPDGAFPGLPDHRKLFLISGEPGAFSEALSLPTPDRTLGPEEGAVPSSLQLDGARLGLQPVAGASLYSFSFTEPGGQLLGTALCFEASVPLPAEILAELGGRSILVGFQPMDSPLSALSTELAGFGAEFPPGLAVGIVTGSVTAPYERLIEFPEPGGIIIGIE